MNPLEFYEKPGFPVSCCGKPHIFSMFEKTLTTSDHVTWFFKQTILIREDQFRDNTRYVLPARSLEYFDKNARSLLPRIAHEPLCRASSD